MVSYRQYGIDMEIGNWESTKTLSAFVIWPSSLEGVFMSSEVVRLREQIEMQSKAAWQGFYGYAQVGRHEIINRRFEQLGESLELLSREIGPDAAIAVVAEALERYANDGQSASS
jgi:hypothetical protein